MDNVIYTSFGNAALEPIVTAEQAEVTHLPCRSNRVEGSGKKAGTASTVEPIRDLSVLKAMRKFFLDEAERTDNQSKKVLAIRNHLLFIIGLNFGLRISDILNLKWEDVTADKFTIKEKKTGKFNTRYLTKDVKQAVEKYKEILDSYDIEYKSTDNLFDMTTQNVIKTLKRAAEKCGFKENIGTHTMRKTFAYWFLMNHKGDSRATTILQSLLNHSDGRVTLKYAGISADEDKEIFESMADFYSDVDSGEVQIVEDKVLVSEERMKELINLAYSLGQKSTGIFQDDMDNINTLQEKLKELEL